MKNVLTEKDYLEIEKRVEQLTNTSQRRWGKMNVTAMLAHCSDQIRLAVGQKKPHEKPSFFNSNIAKYIGLWLPRIPIKNLQGPVDMDQQYFGTAPADIAAEKMNLLTLLQQVRTLPAGAILCPHPMFGKLNYRQWGRFIYVHLDHHLRQFSV